MRNYPSSSRKDIAIFELLDLMRKFSMQASAEDKINLMTDFSGTGFSLVIGFRRFAKAVFGERS
ncbi:MAG: hypothetical protein GW875_00860 [Deltaproteobacteria bacterium]|nr:hypothetical protein [Deltaproteobacteria bacterium]NCP02174.1 hypothetical protein [Deltaproteobacteria bacterium]NCP77954.1 hypothetical protein [Desulfuromonadales bacterium]